MTIDLITSNLPRTSNDPDGMPPSGSLCIWDLMIGQRRDASERSAAGTVAGSRVIGSASQWRQWEL